MDPKLFQLLEYACYIAIFVAIFWVSIRATEDGEADLFSLRNSTHYSRQGAKAIQPLKAALKQLRIKRWADAFPTGLIAGLPISAIIWLYWADLGRSGDVRIVVGLTLACCFFAARLYVWIRISKLKRERGEERTARRRRKRSPTMA